MTMDDTQLAALRDRVCASRQSATKQPRAKRGTGAVSRRKATNAYAACFAVWCKANGFPAPEAEYKFHPTRRWRLDLAWPEHKVYIEVQGGIWIRGRHSRGAGQMNDMAKQNTAAALGWHPILRTPSNLRSDETAELLRQAITGA